MKVRYIELVNAKSFNNWSHRLPEEEFDVDKEGFDVVYGCVAFTAYQESLEWPIIKYHLGSSYAVMHFPASKKHSEDQVYFFAFKTPNPNHKVVMMQLPDESEEYSMENKGAIKQLAGRCNYEKCRRVNYVSKGENLDMYTMVDSLMNCGRFYTLYTSDDILYGRREIGSSNEYSETLLYIRKTETGDVPLALYHRGTYFFNNSSMIQLINHMFTCNYGRNMAQVLDSDDYRLCEKVFDLNSENRESFMRLIVQSSTIPVRVTEGVDASLTLFVDFNALLKVKIGEVEMNLPSDDAYITPMYASAFATVIELAAKRIHMHDSSESHYDAFMDAGELIRASEVGTKIDAFSKSIEYLDSVFEFHIYRKFKLIVCIRKDKTTNKIQETGILASNPQMEIVPPTNSLCYMINRMKKTLVTGSPSKETLDAVKSALQHWFEESDITYKDADKAVDVLRTHGASSELLQEIIKLFSK